MQDLLVCEESPVPPLKRYREYVENILTVLRIARPFLLPLLAEEISRIRPATSSVAVCSLSVKPRRQGRGFTKGC